MQVMASSSDEKQVLKNSMNSNDSYAGSIIVAICNLQIDDLDSMPAT